MREAVGFHLQPGLSKRLNRLLSRFGKRYLEQALKRLESTHGIVVESREAGGQLVRQICRVRARHGYGISEG